MRAGRNPTRRSRNIGTAKQGHGQNNKLVLTTKYSSALGFTLFFEDLQNCQNVTRDFGNRSITFLVEETRPDCIHACTVDDISHILQFVPAADLAAVDFIVLRQPKRKEKSLSPAWGRWHPAVNIGAHSGAAIFLESMSTSVPLRWEKSLTPEFQKELQRLCEDGHQITGAKRHHIISASMESVRNTQLYRTLLHEIGHAVDNARNPDGFDRKSSADKEAFAHRYAGALGEELKQQGVIPFGRISSLQSIEKDGLRLSDFESTKM